jgi:hypothetical protein
MAPDRSFLLSPDSKGSRMGMALGHGVNPRREEEAWVDDSSFVTGAIIPVDGGLVLS